MQFYSRVSENYSKLTHSHKTVASYISENIEELAFNTLEALSESIGVSTTTVIRCARALGYSGFSEMQNEIKSELQSKSSLPERLNRSVDLTENDLLHSSFSTDISNIQKTLDSMRMEDVDAAIKLVGEAKNIYVLGMRSSFSLAHYMVSRLGEIKKNVRFIQSTGLVYPEEIVGAEAGDVCIAYVFPRYSKTTMNILAWLRNRGVKVILFTSFNNLPIRDYGDICFGCATKSVSYKNSMTAPMCLTNYLVAEFARTNYEEAQEVLSRTEEILNSGFYLGI